MESLHKQFLDLENSHLAPAARESNRNMAEILDDEFFEFGISGGICQRSDFNGDYALQEDDYHISRFEAKSLGPESVLTIYVLENRTTGGMEPPQFNMEKTRGRLEAILPPRNEDRWFQEMGIGKTKDRH